MQSQVNVWALEYALRSWPHHFEEISQTEVFESGRLQEVGAILSRPAFVAKQLLRRRHFQSIEQDKEALKAMPVWQFICDEGLPRLAWLVSEGHVPLDEPLLINNILGYASSVSSYGLDRLIPGRGSSEAPFQGQLWTAELQTSRFNPPGRYNLPARYHPSGRYSPTARFSSPPQFNPPAAPKRSRYYEVASEELDPSFQTLLSSWDDMGIRKALEQMDYKERVTSEVMEHIAKVGSIYNMKWLLDQHGYDVEMTVELLLKMEVYSQKMVKSFLDERSVSLPIIEKDILSMARLGTSSTKLFLGLRAKNIAVDQDIIVSLIKARFDGFPENTHIIDFILERNERILLDRGTVEAPGMRQDILLTLLEVLLKHRHHTIPITSDVLEEFLAAMSDSGFDPRTVRSVFENAGERIHVNVSMIEAAAINFECGDDIIAALMNYMHEDVSITPDSLARAATNEGCGDHIMRHLLKSPNCHARITPEVVEYAAANQTCGREILQLLLEHRSGEFQVTPRVVEYAIRLYTPEYASDYHEYLARKRSYSQRVKTRKHVSPTEMLRVLLDHFEEQVWQMPLLLEKVIKCAIHPLSMIQLLLERHNGRLKITENHLVLSVNQSSSKRMIAMLLDYPGDNIEITPRILRSAARTSKDDEASTLHLLIQRAGTAWKIDPALWQAAFENEWNPVPVIVLLLLQSRFPLQMTPDHVKAISQNQNVGFDILLFILQSGREVHLESAIVDSIFEHSKAAVDMSELISRYSSDKVQPNENTLLAAVKGPGTAESTIDYIFDRMKAQITGTPTFLAAIIISGESKEELVLFILRRIDGPVNLTSQVIETVMSHYSLNTLKLLLKRREGYIELTSKALEIAQKTPTGLEKLRFLLAEANLYIDLRQICIPDLLQAFNFDVLEPVVPLLEGRWGEVPIDAGLVNKLAFKRDDGERVLRLLMSKQTDPTVMSGDVFDAIVRRYSYETVQYALRRFEEHLTISSETLKVATRNGRAGVKVLELLLDRSGHEVSQPLDLIKAAAVNEKYGVDLVRKILERLPNQVSITEDIFAVAVRNPKQGVELKQLLLRYSEGEKLETINMSTE